MNPVCDPAIPTIVQSIREHARTLPDQPAILAPGRAPLTYAGLWRQIESTVGDLRRLGIGPEDRVAIVLPNGPEMAVALLAAIIGAVAAPLNPDSVDAELAASFADLGVRAVVVPTGAGAPARRAAEARGLPLVELIPDLSAGAGIFTLQGVAGEPAADALPASPDRPCLLQQTSGTAARPKTFAFTRARLAAITSEQVALLALTATDRSLNMLPLFHLAGVVAMLEPLTAGGSVVCTHGLALPEFFAWLDTLRPTWYMATPTLHQAIVAATLQRGGSLRHTSLRFVQSVSAPLSPELRAELENRIGTSVVEAYGMTEAGAIAVTPLPPHKPPSGSVGIAVSPDVAVMDDAGHLLPPGSTGEIVVAADRVLLPEGESQAAGAVVDGWFRTGDLGWIDAERYVFVAGRVKEMINRGGEKVSPHEVEAALLKHPAVAEAVAFALPHPRLGEEVAAAIVLRAGTAPTSRAVATFAARHLSRHKVPRRVVVVPAIPRGATGKYQRLGLAERLGLAGDGWTITRPKESLTGPRDDIERRIVDIWERLLDVRPVGVDEDFFALGGDSLLAVQMLAELEREFGRKYPDSLLYEAATVAELAARLRERPVAPERVVLVPLKPDGSRPPLFVCMHVGTRGATSYRGVVDHVDPDQPVIGVQSCGLDRRGVPQRRLADIATGYVARIREHQPAGPYHLIGHSAAGLIAYETAQQLLALGETVAFVGLIDSHYFAPGVNVQPLSGPRPRGLAALHPRAVGERLKSSAGALFRRTYPAVRVVIAPPLGLVVPSLRRPSPRESFWVATAAVAAYQGYVPQPYRGRLTLFLAKESAASSAPGSPLGWRNCAQGEFDVREVAGDHTTMLSGSESHELAAQITAALRELR